MRTSRRMRRMAAAAVALLGVACVGLCRAVPPNGDGDYVVLLHGLWRGPWSMKALEWKLRGEGYHVINVGYRSSRLSVHEVSSRLLPEALCKSITSQDKPVHFVTHSLGGIVLREFLAQHPELQLGRVVMLAPPNHGSEVAENLRRIPVMKGLLGPAGRALGTGTESVPLSLGPANFELGIIAGDRSLNPLFSAWLQGPDDGKVSVQSTRLAGMKEHVVVHCSHTWIIWRKDVLESVCRFLSSGTFAPPHGEAVDQRLAGTDSGQPLQLESANVP